MDKDCIKSRCEGCIIKQFNALNSLNNEELSKISDIKKEISLKKGEQLFFEGQKLKGLYCVKSGNTKLSKTSDNGNSQIIRIVGKGELLGTKSLISENSTNLDAIALTDMELCFIPKEKFTSLTHNKKFIRALLKYISNEIVKSDNKFVDLAQKSVKQRLSNVLIYLNDEFGNDSEGFIGLYLKRNEIADLIGTSKEGCIRILSSFKKKNLIEIKGKRIKIINRANLSKITLGLFK